ncbi:hypothetical protein [Paenibacillus sp. B1-33]|uniref:hypothetical protein n=1 Tax=unclassified Paenibacillus TaxID=185978 RepID=UPI003D2D7E35
MDFNSDGSSGDYTVYVGFWGPGTDAMVQVDNLTLRPIEPDFNLVDDNLFDNQTKAFTISAPWSTEGDAVKGVILGENAVAYIRASSGWNAINQRIATEFYGTHTAWAQVKTSTNVQNGFFGVRDMNGNIVKEVMFGPLSDGASPLTFSFNGTNDPMMTLYIGYWAPDTDSWIQIDNVGVFAQSSFVDSRPWTTS